MKNSRYYRIAGLVTYSLRTLLSIIVCIAFLSDICAQPSDSLVWQMVLRNDLNYTCRADITVSDNKDRAAFQYCMISEPIRAQRTYESEYEKVMITDVEKYVVRDGYNAVRSYLEEHHHRSDHRLIATLFLKTLYDHGVRDIAIEGLDAIDTEINQRGYPKYLISGTYLRDPEYANLIRVAISLGFTVHSYDQIRAGKDREYNSAEHLCDYLSENEIDKLFIYCGFDHVKENGTSVVSILSSFLDTDPFTISQTEHQGEPFRYDALVCESSYTLYERSSINYEKKGKGLKHYRGENGDVDMCLFTREDFLNRRTLGSVLTDYKKVKLSTPLKRIKAEHFPFLLKVYESSYQGELAIPVDVAQIDSYSDDDEYFVNVLNIYDDYKVEYVDCNGEVFLTKDLVL